MTESQQLHQDLQFVRHAVDKRDARQPTPAGILIVWGVYVLIGYTLLDFNRVAAAWFFAIAGVVGGILSAIIGRKNALKSGRLDRDIARREMLHWNSIVLGIAAVIALAVCQHDQLQGNRQIVGQMIAIIVGLVYFLAGVHFDRYFIGLGIFLMAGAVAISFVPAYGWTMLGVLLATGLLLPVVLRRKATQPVG